VALYTGNGSTQTISGLGFSPDLVWTKARSVATSHNVYDSVRGANIALFTDGTDAEITYTTRLTSFNSDGFSLGNNTGNNDAGTTYVAWTWDAGNSTVTNNDGTITSQVRANPSAGFSIVTYTGTGSNATVGHGLGVTPAMLIVKQRTGTGAPDWGVWHTSLGGGDKFLYLSSASSVQTNTTPFNGTLPTSSVFSVGAWAGTNQSSGTYVAYCFAPVEGYSAFGSYTGNNIADGPFVYTGFRPRWILIKSASSNVHWTVWDAARDPENAATRYLYPSDLIEERTNANIGVDFLSNGFKIRGTDQNYNGNENNHIYAAFAESPFQYARAR